MTNECDLIFKTTSQRLEDLDTCICSGLSNEVQVKYMLRIIAEELILQNREIRQKLRGNVY